MINIYRIDRLKKWKGNNWIVSSFTLPADGEGINWLLRQRLHVAWRSEVYGMNYLDLVRHPFAAYGNIYLIRKIIWIVARSGGGHVFLTYRDSQTGCQFQGLKY